MSTKRLTEFVVEVSRARDLIGLGQSIGGLTFGQVDGSDLYRSALVQAVASLDSYVHGMILDRSVDILLGYAPATRNGAKLGLNFNAIQEIVTAQTPTDSEISARRHVAQRLSLETFQRPDAIATAFSMVGISGLWSRAFPSNAERVKQSLSLIVQRRNRIVHQCDSDPLTPGSVTPLSADDVIDSVKTVESCVVAIDTLC
jgi:hypothetical protein